MSFESFEQAAEALSAESNTPETPVIPTTENTPTPNAQPEEQGTTPKEGSTDFDTSSLTPEEIQAGYLRRDDYTRKTQEIAPLRKFMQEAGVSDVGQVQQAWEFASRLQADPVGTFNQLQQLMQQQGYLQSGAVQQPAPVESEGEYEEIELPPHLQAKLAAVDQIQARLDAQEAAQRQFYLEQEMGRQEHMIRQMNPDYAQKDMDAVMTFAHATGGNLEEANNLYQGVLQHVLSHHIKTKSGIPDSVTAPGTQGHSVTPLTAPKTLDDAHVLAKEYLRSLGE